MRDDVVGLHPVAVGRALHPQHLRHEEEGGGGGVLDGGGGGTTGGGYVCTTAGRENTKGACKAESKNNIAKN